MDTEERDERGSGRSQNVVHTLPRSMASVPNFLTGPLERVDPAAGYPRARAGCYNHGLRAGVAQLVEQRIRNAKVGGSTPSTGTIFPSP